MKQKIAIVGTNGVPGRYGGWDQLMDHLLEHLGDAYQFTVYTSSFDAVKGLKEYKGAKIQTVRLRANGYQSVIYDAWSLFHALWGHKAALVLGTSGCLFFPLVRLSKMKLILNPDGAEWKRKKWKLFAKKFLLLSESLGIRYANEVIADNVCIANYLTDRYSVSPHLIAYGGDNAKFVALTEKTSEEYSVKAGQYAFKVCRIEPENNIHLILEAFSQIKLKLILVGNWNFSSYGKQLRDTYSTYENLSLLDPIYNQLQLDELRANCNFYVHGHTVGGTNPSLVEAMNLNLCCVVFDVDYNQETTEGKALYFKDANTLLDTISRIESSDIDISTYRSAMGEIAQRRYQWTQITEAYGSVFEQALNPENSHNSG